MSIGSSAIGELAVGQYADPIPTPDNIVVNTQSELLREPNLLVPGKLPINSVMVDHQHPLAPTESVIFTGAHKFRNLDGVPLTKNKTSGDDLYIQANKLILDQSGGKKYLTSSAWAKIKAHSGSFTVICRAKGVADNSNALCLFGSLGDSGERGTAGGPNNSGDTNFYIASNSTTLVNSGATVTGVFSANEWITYACVYEASTRMQHYANGESLGINTTSIPASSYTGSSYSFKVATRGGGGTPTDSYLDGEMEFFYWWSRALSSSAVKEIYRDSYQFLIPA